MLSTIPNNNFLHDYVKWAGNNETPKKYHLFAGMVVLASVLARRVFFQRMDRVYPNLYVIFVSAPGTGKSTASDIGENLLRRLNPGLRPRLQSGKITPEAFRNWLSRRVAVDGHPALDGAIGTVFADELSVFLGKQKYNEGMVSLLTKIYNSPDLYEDETIGFGRIRLENVCLTLIGTTVDDSLINSVNETALNGGFVSRVLWVVGEQADERWPFPPPLDDVVANNLCSFLIGLSNLDGDVYFDDDAIKLYEDWYNVQPRSHPIIGGYYERKPTHVLKMAMLIHFGQHKRKGRKVNKECVEAAIAICDLLEPDTELVTTSIKTKRPGRISDQLYNMIFDAERPVTFREIVEFLYRQVTSMREIDTILTFLIARKKVREVKLEDDVAYEAVKCPENVA